MLRKLFELSNRLLALVLFHIVYSLPQVLEQLHQIVQVDTLLNEQAKLEAASAHARVARVSSGAVRQRINILRVIHIFTVHVGINSSTRRRVQVLGLREKQTTVATLWIIKGLTRIAVH